MKKDLSILKRIFIYLAICLLFILFCSCSTGIWVHYPMRLSRTKMYISEGRDDLAEKELNKRLKSNQDQLLRSMELGMIYYMERDFDSCIKEWLVAERMMEKFERRPVVSIREVGEKIGTLAVNDYLITYQGMTYERVLLHLYLALAHIMKSDLEGARIELKKAEQVQKKGFDRWQEKRADQLRDSPEASQIENELLTVYESRYGISKNYSSFSLNPFVYYLSGWLYEEEGYPDEALIDYKRIWDLGLRLDSLTGRMKQLEKAMGFSWGSAGSDLDKKSGHLLIIHQQGLIPTLEEFRFPIEIKGSVVMMAIPVYPHEPLYPMGLRIRSGSHELETQELVNVYSLAKESLKERIPGIVTRQLARMVLKANASRQMSKKGGSLASMVTTIYNIVSEKADLRSWLTIPLSIQVGQIVLPAGRHIVNLDLIDGVGCSQVEVEIKPGGFHILDVRSIGSRMITHIS